MTDDRPTFGSLFSGIGGIDLGLERAGWRCRWQVEVDPEASKVLAHRWPEVPRYGDVHDLDLDRLERVDLIAGGFPCQPVSVAGQKRGRADERWLWPAFAGVIAALRPRVVLVENVPGLLRPLRFFGGRFRWGEILYPAPIGDVLGDLHVLGYDAERDGLAAVDVGAPHLRNRIFILGVRKRSPIEGARLTTPSAVSDSLSGALRDERERERQ